LKKKFIYIIAIILIVLSLFIFLLTQNNNLNANSYETDLPAKDGNITYLNTTKNVKYTGVKSCIPCHRSISGYWDKSEMGRTMEVMSEDNVVEIYPQKFPVYDEVNDFYYEMFRKEEKFFQKEYRKNSEGKIIHERIMQAEYAIGSGNNLRMYFHNENGMFYQLPLTWNSHKKTWDLSPGFREYENLRFSRFAAKKCIFCHNSYLDEDPTSPDHYLKPFVIGISCERCHGPGELHIKEQVMKLKIPENSKTIVNPTELSLKRELAICMQCHLEGKAWVLKDKDGWFDFRPGQLLSENRSVYYPAVTSKEEIEVGDSPHRLMLSRCFKESNNQLTCISCHDPHKSIHSFTRKHYNDVCIECHKINSMPSKNSEHNHKSKDDCVSCHMNRTGIENTLHGVSLTDHWIRVDANKTKIDWAGVRHPEKRPLIQLVSTIDSVDQNYNIRKGIAYYEYRNEYDYRKDYLDSALTYLLTGLGEVPTSEAGFFYLGEVFDNLGRTDDAIENLNKAIKINPKYYQAYYELGKLYENKNELNKASDVFRKAIQLMPNDPAAIAHLGFALANDNYSEAVQLLEKALLLDKQNPYVYYNLGNIYALKLNDPARALNYFSQAVTLDPDIEDGYLNLGNTYAMLNEPDSAIESYNKYLYRNPNSLSTYINLARVYEGLGNKQNAILNYRKALKISPDNELAKQFLNNLLQ
jgi:predicted CXXCH cytochrome family protein